MEGSIIGNEDVSAARGRNWRWARLDVRKRKENYAFTPSPRGEETAPEGPAGHLQGLSDPSGWRPRGQPGS